VGASTPTKAVLRGRKAPAIWNPHTGEQAKGDATPGEAAGQPVTTIHLVLPSVGSLFFIGEPQSAALR
jgi:hypothetical protein